MTHRRFHFLLAALILLVGLFLRVRAALESPAISRDGVKFCRQAEALGVDFVAALRNPEFEQHPLYATLVLGAQRLGDLVLGSGAGPIAWQSAALGVSLLAGAGVIVLTGLLALRLARLVTPSSVPERVGELAMLFAAVLPLSVWQSADAMSDELHVMFYLAACCAAVATPRAWSASRAGFWAGLAFLTRPEGAVVGVCAALGWLRDRSAGLFRRRIAHAGLMLGVMAACIAPYCLTIGKLTPKAAKETTEQIQGSAAAGSPWAPPLPRDDGGVPLLLAALVRDDVAWFLVLPRALLELFRAGRVVVPLLAIPALCMLGRRALETRAFAVLGSMMAHFALTLVLLYRHGYLNPRHELVVVALMIPFAALTLDRLAARAVAFVSTRGAHKRGAAATVAPELPTYTIVAVLTCAPLVVYALRAPNAESAYIREMARVLIERDPHAHEKLLLGGSSQSRIAFYTDMRFQPWPENLASLDDQCAALRDHLLHNRPDYFAIDLGRGRETERNSELLARLATDPAIAPQMSEWLRVTRNPDRRSADDSDRIALLFALNWNRPASSPTSQATALPVP